MIMSAQNIHVPNKRALPIMDLDAEVRAFEEAERKRLGIDEKV